MLRKLREALSGKPAQQLPEWVPPEVVAPPLDIWAEHAKWTALAAERKFGEAIKLCLAAIKEPASNFVASSFLGYAYFQLGQLDDAERYLTAALVLNPDDHYARLTLGHVLVAAGRPREALLAFSRCCGGDVPAELALEPFESGLKLAVDLREGEEGAAFAEAFEKLQAEQKLPDLVAAKFLFFYRRDADLLALLERSEGPQYSLRYIDSVKGAVAHHGGNYVKLGEPVSIRIVNPAEDYASNMQVKHVQASTPYVAELIDAMIVGDSSLIRVGTTGVVSDALADPRYGSQVNMAYDQTLAAQRPDALLLRQPGGEQFLDEGIMLSGLASNAYGHWVGEYLPKLRHFEKLPNYQSLPILVDDEMPKSHFDLLALIAANPIHRIPKGNVVRVGRLHVAPTLTFFPVELFPNHTVPPEDQQSWTAESLCYLKERVEAHFSAPAASTRRIFLSRKNSSWRVLKNEDELIAGLVPEGFETVFMEELDFDQQVKLFRESEFIVAPNGSVLNSLIFAPRSVKLLVLGQQNSHNWGGWLGPMLDLGYRPEFLEGDATQSSEFKHSDYEISTAKVLDRVRAMLEPRGVEINGRPFHGHQSWLGD